MAKVLGVHHHNVYVVIQPQSLICDNGAPLWKLAMKNKDLIYILLVTKVIVLKWWALET
jgi:hypothetical protein